MGSEGIHQRLELSKQVVYRLENKGLIDIRETEILIGLIRDVANSRRKLALAEDEITEIRRSATMCMRNIAINNCLRGHCIRKGQKTCVSVSTGACSKFVWNDRDE